jgi:hypothetical protein
VTAEEIRESLRRGPFEPLGFHLTSGDTYEIHDPTSVALGARRVFIAEPGSDRFVSFPYLHIAATETVRDGRIRRPRRHRR